MFPVVFQRRAVRREPTEKNAGRTSSPGGRGSTRAASRMYCRFSREAATGCSHGRQPMEWRVLITPQSPSGGDTIRLPGDRRTYVFTGRARFHPSCKSGRTFRRSETRRSSGHIVLPSRGVAGWGCPSILWAVNAVALRTLQPCQITDRVSDPFIRLFRLHGCGVSQCT